MDEPPPRRVAAAAITVTAALLTTLVATPSLAAAPEVAPGTPADDAPAVADVAVPTDPVDVGTVATPLVFAAGEGVALALADGRRFLDRLELTLAGDGQRLVNDLTLDDYVAGVAEMPARWASEALKAQAVAARTYAWHQAELGTYAGRGYDICDTVACQAFRGAAQEEDDWGDRWRAAVDETSGEVLLDDGGGPILARYFSTSGGRTLPNEVVFPSSGPRPYLVGIDDPADEVSPYHRWQVTFTREEFETVLSAGEQLSTVVPIAAVEREGDVDVPGADVRFVGEDGTEVVLDSVDVRRFVSEVAPERFPDRFPTARADGLRPLPATLPSSRFTVEIAGDEVVVDGRGWGHGVGMGQYGARARADDGAGYADILAAYYGGLAPTTSDDVPERMRVGLSGAAVGSVAGDGPVTITADGEPVAEAVSGTWTLAREGDRVRLTAPPGTGEPATASRTEVSSRLPSTARQLAVDAAAGVPGRARLVVTSAGEPVAERDLGTDDAGIRSAMWDLTDDAGDPVPEGDYDVLLEIVAADGSTAGTPLPVTVTATSGLLGDLAGGDDGSGIGPVAALAGAALLVLALVAARRRRSHPRRERPLHPRPPTRPAPDAVDRGDRS